MKKPDGSLRPALHLIDDAQRGRGARFLRRLAAESPAGGAAVSALVMVSVVIVGAAGVVVPVGAGSGVPVGEDGSIGPVVVVLVVGAVVGGAVDVPPCGETVVPAPSPAGAVPGVWA